MKTMLPLILLLLALASPALADEWTVMASMPYQVHHPVTFTLDGKGYAFTGTIPGQSASKIAQSYDPVAGIWTVLPDFPGAARGFAVGCAYGGYGYVGFGSVGGTYFNDLWRYDPVSESWTSLGNLAMPGRAHPAFVLTDAGKIYIGLGEGPGNFGDWYEYDIATQTLTQRANLTGPARHHPYFFNIGDVPYVCFGHGTSTYNDVYRFDPGTNTWTQLLDLPAQGRVGGTQFSYDGMGYALSGLGQNGSQLATGEFWRYDPVANSWTQLTAHPDSGRWAPGSFVIDNKLYMMGGLSTGGLQSSMWMYEFVSPTSVPAAAAIARLDQNHPNPFNPETVFGFTLERASRVRLSVFDADGRQVDVLLNGEMGAGPHSVPWRAEGLTSGIYFYRLETEGGTQTRKATLLK